MQFVYRLLQKECCMKLKDAIRYYELTGCDVFDDFKKQKVIYVLGMSVPPLAMYRISKEIQTQWLDKL